MDRPCLLGMSLGLHSCFMTISSHLPILFPPASAAKGIKLIPSVCVCPSVSTPTIEHWRCQAQGCRVCQRSCVFILNIKSRLTTSKQLSAYATWDFLLENLAIFCRPAMFILSETAGQVNFHVTLTDYRHTDKHLRLVMSLVALCWTRQSRAPIINRTDRHPNGQTDRRTLPSSLSPSLSGW